MYDVIIIGAGPAGLSAGLHAASNNLKTLVIAKEIPAEKTEAGFLLIDFAGLVSKAKKSGLELLEKEEVIALEKNIVSFSVETKAGHQFYSQSIIVATGCVGEEGSTGFDRVTLKDGLGKIMVDANMQTNIPGIFAAGDVAVSLAKGLASSIIEGAKAALSLDKALKKGDN